VRARLRACACVCVRVLRVRAITVSAPPARLTAGACDTRNAITHAELFSSVFSFSTLHADAGSEAHPLRVASIGDMSYGNESDDTVARLTELVDAGAIDMVIHNGNQTD
jgi:hypothetical protein